MKRHILGNKGEFITEEDSSKQSTHLANNKKITHESRFITTEVATKMSSTETGEQ